MSKSKAINPLFFMTNRGFASVSAALSSARVGAVCVPVASDSWLTGSPELAKNVKNSHVFPKKHIRGIALHPTFPTFAARVLWIIVQRQPLWLLCGVT